MMAKDNYPICPTCGERGDCNECCQITFEDPDSSDEQRAESGVFL